MSKTAKRFLILNLIILTVTGALFAFMYREINRTGSNLISFVELRREQDAKKDSALLVRRTIQETESNRLLLNQAFFATESDSIQFLTNTERIAASAGLKVSTDSLERKKISWNSNDIDVVEITFSTEGTYELIESFLKYLESIPYHSRLESVSLKKISDNNLWSLRVTIIISILNQK